MSTISEGVADVRGRIDRAARAAGRGQVRLLLAVKTVPAPRILTALSTGVTLIGHNRAQEMRDVEPALAATSHESHFIGHLQSNKVNQVMRWADCVQSVDSAKLALRLDRAAAARQRDLDVFIQVNTSAEDSKAGVAPADLPELVQAVAHAGHLHLRGFMTIGANASDRNRVLASYTALANIRDEVLASGTAGTESATELSMGMSGDLEVAIEAGATMVRVGSGVFGRRSTPPAGVG